MSRQAIRIEPVIPPVVPRLALLSAGGNGSAPAAPRRDARCPGRRVLPDAQWARIANALRFSPRELQIVQAVFDDEKEAAIAGALGISPHTVHTHLERIYRKAGAFSRATLIIRVFAEHMKQVDGE